MILHKICCFALLLGLIAGTVASVLDLLEIVPYVNGDRHLHVEKV